MQSLGPERDTALWQGTQSGGQALLPTTHVSFPGTSTDLLVLLHPLLSIWHGMDNISKICPRFLVRRNLYRREGSK